VHWGRPAVSAECISAAKRVRSFARTDWSRIAAGRCGLRLRNDALGQSGDEFFFGVEDAGGERAVDPIAVHMVAG